MVILVVLHGSVFERRSGRTWLQRDPHPRDCVEGRRKVGKRGGAWGGWLGAVEMQMIMGLGTGCSSGGIRGNGRRISRLRLGSLFRLHSLGDLTHCHSFEYLLSTKTPN